MMVCSSHSPLIYFPGRETDATRGCRAALAAQQERVHAFDPQLVVVFGTDHYGGHSMSPMSSFCVGTAATALADVGGFPGELNVPEAVAEACVDFVRAADVDVSVSYSMEVDHGFSQALQEVTGSVDRYPVLPIFVNCIAPPFVPFKRVAALGRAVGAFLQTTDYERVLIVGTGGVSHDPAFLFPAIHDVGPEWRMHHLLGIKQSGTPRQAWIDWEIEIHHQAAGMLADEAAKGTPNDQFSIITEFDQKFLGAITSADLKPLESWDPNEVVGTAGIGAMEVMSWVASANCAQTVGAKRPEVMFYEPILEFGVGFGIIESAA